MRNISDRSFSQEVEDIDLVELKVTLSRKMKARRMFTTSLKQIRGLQGSFPMVIITISSARKALQHLCTEGSVKKVTEQADKTPDSLSHGSAAEFKVNVYPGLGSRLGGKLLPGFNKRSVAATAISR